MKQEGTAGFRVAATRAGPQGSQSCSRGQIPCCAFWKVLCSCYRGNKQTLIHKEAFRKLPTCARLQYLAVTKFGGSQNTFKNYQSPQDLLFMWVVPIDMHHSSN